MTSAFVQAAVILLREGLEAMLVIAALAAYLLKMGAAQRVKELYAGAGVAVLVSFIAAWIFSVFNSGDHNDILEGIVILVAASLMLYVSGWLMVKQDPRTWKNYISAQADKALATNTSWAIAALAFLAVFREGAETVLFINTLARTEGGWTAGLFAGIAAATVGLIVLFYLINILAGRLPLRFLFVSTSLFLFLMALKFIGDAIQEFQEQNIISTTDNAAFSWLAKFGLNASQESLSIIFLVVVAIIAVNSIIWRNIKLREFAPN